MVASHTQPLSSQTNWQPRLLSLEDANSILQPSYSSSTVACSPLAADPKANLNAMPGVRCRVLTVEMQDEAEYQCLSRWTFELF